MAKISAKGVIVGSITDIIATNIAMVPLIFYIMHGLMKTAASSQELSADAGDILRIDPVYFTISTIIGGLCSILGGYVAAWIAGRHEILNGALASFLCITAGIYAIAWGHDGTPLWEHIVFMIAAPILTGFGGYLRMRY